MGKARLHVAGSDSIQFRNSRRLVPHCSGLAGEVDEGSRFVSVPNVGGLHALGF